MKDFVKQAVRTEAPVTEQVLGRLLNCARLIHAQLGKLTEIGEFADELKRHIFYGKELDKTNLKEEIGDGFWYDALALDDLGEEELYIILEMVIAKLKKRFPEKFTEELALNRDLEAERETLEVKVAPLQTIEEVEDALMQGATKTSTPFQIHHSGAADIEREKAWGRMGYNPHGPNISLGKFKFSCSHFDMEWTFDLEAASPDAAMHQGILKVMEKLPEPKGNKKVELPRLYSKIKRNSSVTKA
jgi:NTP pyrophosphatase (non-canonical NTP hydrolase)